ncbi:MAG TPA: hypothetical protein VE078_00500 [Thermoanaerobaculia bacterium]|nr:hypothetical protein [Thermoanaerobaculia bacterium]
MTREQYEARKLRLEEERQAAMELVQASYNTQVRALEMVWMSFSGEPVGTPSQAPPPSPPIPANAAPQKPPRPRPDQIYADVTAALPRLPEIFDRNHICKAIGYEPDRVALYRILNELVQEGTLHVQARGLGKKGTKYRRA